MVAGYACDRENKHAQPCQFFQRNPVQPVEHLSAATPVARRCIFLVYCLPMKTISTPACSPNLRLSEPLKWNQLCVVAKHQGQTSCWTAWKRRIPAFNDPRLWESLAAWPEYFTRQPKDVTWGLQGYGLIAMDLDNKLSWSINDYALPTSVQVLGRQERAAADSEDSAALLQLLARPDQWVRANLHLAEVGVPFSGSGEPGRRVLFAEIVPVGTPPERALELLTPERGVLTWEGRQYHVLGGQYLPKDWTAKNDRGREPHLSLRDLLRDLHQAGFAPPDAANIRGAVLTATADMGTSTERRINKAVSELLATWPAAPTLPIPPAPKKHIGNRRQS